MELENPTFISREHIFAGRGARAERARCTGLWVVGSLAGLAGPTVAIVGTRAPSDGGRARATAMARALARAGVTVISGLAMGIDACGHRGALEAMAAPTIGVLGGGHRHFFPRAHRDLARTMIAVGGAVISPFAPDEPARPFQFLQRNAIVAALADAVVVVEAARRSGALSTANWAAEFGVDVLAMPGDVDRALAAGTNGLIRDGATLVRDAADVVDALGLERLPFLSHHVDEAASSSTRKRDPVEGAIIAALASEPLDLEALRAVVARAMRGPIETGTILAALVRLELDGIIDRQAGLVYALRQDDGVCRR